MKPTTAAILHVTVALALLAAAVALELAGHDASWATGAFLGWIGSSGVAAATSSTGAR